MPDKGMPDEEIFGHVVDAARALGVTEIEAILGSDYEALTRFANNGIHQNVAERTTQLSVRPLTEGRTARASTNRLDRDAIRAVVEQSVALARLMEPDADLLPLPEPADCATNCAKAARYFEGTAQATPEGRARAVAAAIGVVESAGQTAAGIYSTGESVFALFNSRGVACRHSETLARFSITAMADGSSGWAKASACNLADLDPLGLAQTAARKAGESHDPRELPPDRYTVILEPAAVLDLVGQMFGDFSATAIRDGRSFLNDRTGHKLFGENITIHDDAFHPAQSGAPFDGEGLPRRRLTLVDRGVVREIAYSRPAAAL
ncbi:MAG TPA: metallopeptidase TldD-related protein, partial [Candidatus Solibacter sp.]|nr:metallopeptidase TldD-related protein [Candidatus Solibacter sp.]